jgi:hypothetical protein
MAEKDESKKPDAPAPLTTISQRGIAEAAKLPAAILEQVMVNGDLSPLSTAHRLSYYSAVCKSLGLNPLTKPFAYLRLNNKLMLYALKACTDQLRANHNLSVRVTNKSTQGGMISVTAQVQAPDGRVDEDIGVVPIGNLKGEPLANAYMKAVTKAKRRATLSLCGMGWLDESEIDSIAGARTAPIEPFKDEAEPGEIVVVIEQGADQPAPGAPQEQTTPAQTQVLEPDTVVPDEPAPASPTPAAQPAASSTQPGEKGERYPAGTDVDKPACPRCGGPMWDYRERSRGGKGTYEKQSPNAPDFRCQKKSCAAEKGVRWPRKDDDQPTPHEADASEGEVPF